MSTVAKKIVLLLLHIPNWAYNRMVFKYKNVSYLNYPKISGKIFITGRGKIEFGKDVRINSSLSSNPIGGDTRSVISVSQGAILKVGSNTGFSNIAIFCMKKIVIGEHVKIGGSVKIYDSDFHSLSFQDRKESKTDKPAIKAVELKDGCFIGAHSIILKGVIIGKQSIIGAGSVVTKSVPDNEIWGGNPAKFIRKI